MEMDQGMEERSVWNFGNYLRTALFILFACAIISHDRTDLALLEGGISGPAIYHNWIGFLGAHTSRIMFYLFGLATYPVLLIVFLMLLRRFIPGLPRRGSLWWALPVILLGASMLFAMWPQHFVTDAWPFRGTNSLGIGRVDYFHTNSGDLTFSTEQAMRALSGGVVGASLAAPQVSTFQDAGLIRRYIGDVGTVLVALAFLLPGVVFLFIRDWLPLLVAAFKHDSKKPQDTEGTEVLQAQPVSMGHTGRIYTPDNPDGEIWNPTAGAAPEIRQYTEEESGGDAVLTPEEKPPRLKNFFVAIFGFHKTPEIEMDKTEENGEEDEEVIAPPVRPPAQTRNRLPAGPSTAIREPEEVVAPPQARRPPRSTAGTVIRDPDELVVTPHPKPAPAAEPTVQDEEPAAFALQSEPQSDEPEAAAEDIPAPPPAPEPAPRVIPTQTFAENKAKFDRTPPPPAPADEPEPPPPVYEEYHLPSPMLLDRRGSEIATEDKKYIQNATDRLEETLQSFNVEGIISGITVGPRVTQFEISLNPGVKVEKITSIQPNICMAMEAQSIRIRAPIPGKNAVGIEIPNKVSNTVYLRPLLESATWRESHAAIPILLGRDIAGEVYLTDLSKAPHLLIAGSTGSGKSVCMNTLIMSLLFRFSPDELKLIMVDPKVVELEMYRPIPHLITPVVNDPKKVPLALRWGVNEMERRYLVLAKVKAKNLAAFNSRPPDPQPVLDDYGEVIPPKLPILIIIIDELADIMMTDAKSDVETSICRIAQKGRAAGVHLVIATQSPRKEVVTGLIKANIPTKIAFRVSNGMDSRVILDAVGAEKLLGNGDMLFNPPGGANLERIQGAYVSDPEIARVIDEVAAQRPQMFDEGIFAGGGEDEDEDEDTNPKGRHGRGKSSRGSRGDGYDDELDDYDETDGMANSEIIKAAAGKYLDASDPPIMVKALEIIINEQQVSTSYLQRRLGIGYNKAADIIDKLEQRHVISAPLPGGQKRSILITDGLETPND